MTLAQMRDYGKQGSLVVVVVIALEFVLRFTSPLLDKMLPGARPNDTVTLEMLRIMRDQVTISAQQAATLDAMKAMTSENLSVNKENTKAVEEVVTQMQTALKRQVTQEDLERIEKKINEISRKM